MLSNWLSLSEVDNTSNINIIDHVNDAKSDYCSSSDAEPTAADIKRLHKNVLNRTLEIEVEDAFFLFDRNCDKKLDFFECQAAFKALRLNSSSDTIREIFIDLGKNENDLITLTDFKTLVITKLHTRYSTNEMERIFNQLQDGTGKITLESLREAVTRIGCETTDDELSLMITEASGNRGYVDIDDFHRITRASWIGSPMDEVFETDSN